MPLFDYRCEQGHITRDVHQSIHTPLDDQRTIPCHFCDAPAHKLIAFPVVKKSLQPHHNLATGSYIQNEQALRSEFSRLSDEASERTGVTHSYVPLDNNEAREVCGVDDEGLDSTRRRQVDSGQVATQSYL